MRIHSFASILLVAAIAPSAFGQSDADHGFGDQLSGWYARGSGMLVQPQDSELRDNTGLIFSGLSISDAEMEFDDSFGFTAAVGYSFEHVSLELEYSYRTADFDTVSGDVGGSSLALDAGGDATTHAIMLNGVWDIDLDTSRFGFYVGAGIGLAMTEADLTTVDGVNTGLTEDDDTTFAWQVFGGVTYQLNAQVQLYTGARFFDAGDVDFEVLGAENASISYELGLRFYF